MTYTDHLIRAGAGSSLIHEREQLAELVGRLREPFGDVRAVLREVDAVLRTGLRDTGVTQP